MALSSNIIRLQLVWGCLEILDNLGSRVELCWVQGYTGISDNEKTNLLAKWAARTSFVKPESFCRIGMGAYKRRMGT